MPRGKGKAINVDSIDHIVTYDDEDTTADSISGAKKRRRVVLNTQPPNLSILLDELSTHSQATEQHNTVSTDIHLDEDYFLHRNEEHVAPTPEFAGSTHVHDSGAPKAKVRVCLPLPKLIINAQCNIRQHKVIT